MFRVYDKLHQKTTNLCVPCGFSPSGEPKGAAFMFENKREVQFVIKKTFEPPSASENITRQNPHSHRSFG